MDLLWQLHGLVSLFRFLKLSSSLLILTTLLMHRNKDSLADKLVDVLDFLGIVLRIPNSIMGLTVLAW
jgi:hypothetical protein